MTPLLLAAVLSLSGSPLDAGTPSPLSKDLYGPAPDPLGSPRPAPLLKDLHGPAPAPLDAPVRTRVLPVDLLANLSPDIRQKLLRSRDPALLSGALCQRKAVKTAGAAGAPVKKLGDLPPALEEHAVNRLVDGCPVREIVSGGRTYYLDAPTGGLERLNPTAYRVDEH